MIPSPSIDASIIADALQDPALDASEKEAMSRKLRAVAAVSEAIASTLDMEEMFQRILEQLMISFPQADKTAVLIRNEETGDLDLQAIRFKQGLPQAGFGAGLAVSHTVVHQVMSGGHAVVAQPLVTDSGIPIKPDRCRMGAPIIFQQQIKGVIQVDATYTRHVFTQVDLDLLTSIAMQTAMALQLTEFHKKILKQQQLEQDLQFARRVQQGFLPNTVPHVERFIFAAHYDPAFHVGGDFYDFVDLGDGRMGIIAGDVSGHGISAALFMARLSSHIHSFAVTEREPARVFKRTESLLEENQDGMFATILYAVLDTHSAKVTMANAGHMPPILRRPAEGDVRSMDEVQGLMLGVLPDEPIPEHEYQLAPGETLLFYSDGIYEAHDASDREYGIGRLQWICGQGDPSAPVMIQRILRDFDRHLGDLDHPDDITIIAFSYTG